MSVERQSDHVGKCVKLRKKFVQPAEVENHYIGDAAGTAELVEGAGQSPLAKFPQAPTEIFQADVDALIEDAQRAGYTENQIEDIVLRDLGVPIGRHRQGDERRLLTDQLA